MLVPAQLETFKDVLLDTPVDVFSYSTPLPFQFIDTNAGQLPGYPIAVYLLECEKEISDPVEIEFKKAQGFFSREREIDRESLPKIGAERDILETQVLRAGEQIRGIAEQAAEILLAWVAEALFAMEEMQGEQEQERGVSRMIGEVKFFWERFAKGFPLKESNVRQWLSTLYRENLDVEFVRGQEFGILHHASLRDRINTSAMRINDRREAIEYLLYFVLNDIPLVDEEIKSKFRATDSRVKGAHLKEPMVKKYYQILDTETGITPKQARMRVLVEFEELISDRQLQRYIQELPRYY